MTCEDMTVGLSQNVGDDGLGCHDDDSFLSRGFETGPKHAVLNKRIKRKLVNQIAKVGLVR